MKADEARKIIDAQLQQLVQALVQGQSETLNRYLAVLAKFHRYSFRNVLLIMAQRPDATHVAGFHAWKQLGRFVKKGEKGIAIIAPVARRPSTEEESEPKADPPPAAFKVSYVFDVVQTEGEPLAQLAEAQGEPGLYLPRLKQLVAEHQIALSYAATLGGPDGVSRGGSILLREGLSAAEEFSVLVHEFGHELLHHHGNGQSKTERETEAEAVACVVSEAIGLKAGDAARDYIQYYRGDAETLMRSLCAIQDVASVILRGLFEAG